jgi:cysteine desulfurase
MLPKIKKPTKPIYLDFAATTPVRTEVVRVMNKYLSLEYGNPSSLYSLGQKAKGALEESRKKVAGILNSKDSEIVFTAGGTESINLAIFGVVRNYLKHNKNKKPHIITTTIEHHAVLECYKALEEEGVGVTYLNVDHEGFIDTKQLEKEVKPNTVLLSIIYANNEIGTIQDITTISKVVKGINKERFVKRLPQIVFHTDGCQASSLLDIDVQRLGVDLLTLNASKVYGPKQVGLLYIRTGVPLLPLVYGGGQEKGLRSGTENVAGVAGFALALELAQKEKAKEVKRLAELSKHLYKNILKKIPRAHLNGPDILEQKNEKTFRLPNNVNFSLPGIDGDALVLYLDSYGIASSTGSACSSTSLDPSHVITKLGKGKDFAKSSVRFSLGRNTNKKELDYLLKVLPGLVSELRKTTTF